VGPAGDTGLPDLGDEFDAEIQRIADPLALRAIAHPKRLALLELLLVEGVATATRCAQVLGDSPSSWSFHLRTLARYKLVEEAPGGAGRRRPWRLASLGQSWSSIGADLEPQRAADELDQVLVQREVARILTWLRTRRAYPERWQRGAHVAGTIAYLTPDELTELGEELGRLLLRHSDRLTDPARRPQDARLVRLLGFGFPLPPPPTEEAPSDAAP
jgi:Helix-turn-helix domain